MPMELARESPACPAYLKSKNRAAAGNVAFEGLSTATKQNGPESGRFAGVNAEAHSALAPSLCSSFSRIRADLPDRARR